MESVAILPDDRVTIDQIDSVVIPESTHRVADVVSFDNVSSRCSWVRVALVEVVNGVASHFFILYL